MRQQEQDNCRRHTRFKLEPIYEEGCRIAFSPNQAPVYGGGRIVIGFAEDTSLEAGANYYLLFEGTGWRHITTAQLVNPHTLRAFIPEHGDVEEVCLSILMCHVGNQKVLASCSFGYIYDSTYHLARYLVDSVYEPECLHSLDLVKSEHFNLLEENFPTLDERLTRAFQYVDVPEGWNLLGLDIDIQDPPPRESLLHFAARLGLEHFTEHLLHLPGSKEALHLVNPLSELPVDVAKAAALDNLVNMLSDDGWTENLGNYWRKRHSSTPGRYLTPHEGGLITVSSHLSESHHSIDDDLDWLENHNTTVMQPRRTASTGTRRSSSSASTGSQPDFHHMPGVASRHSASDVMLHGDDTDDSDDDTFEADHMSNADLHPHGGGRRYRQRSDQHHHTSSHYRRHYRKQPQPSPQQPRSRSASTPKDFSSTYSPHALPDSETLVPPGDVNRNMTGVPSIYVSPAGTHKKSEVLEENLRRLQEINDGIQRLRELNTNQLTLQDARKETLQRFSTSCPSLADQVFPKSPVQHLHTHPQNESGHFKSMLDLAHENAPHPHEGATMPEMDYHENDAANHNAPGECAVESDVRIIINDVTVDSTEDYSGQESGNEDGNELSVVRKLSQKRRSSWCPEEGKKKEEKREKARMLAVQGRSQSLSSLDGQDDDDSDDDDSDGSYSEQKAQRSPTSSPGRSTLNTTPDQSANRSSSCPSVSINFGEVADFTEPLFPTANSTPSGGNKLSVTPPPRPVTFSTSSSGASVSSVRSLTDIRLDYSSGLEVPDGCVGMSPGNSRSEDGDISTPGGTTLAVPGPQLMKSVSTPAIPSIDARHKVHHDRRSGPITEVISDVNHSQASGMGGASGGGMAEEPDEDELLNALLQTERAQTKQHVSMIEFLNDPTNFEDDDDRPKREVKEEKKRRSSVFSKLGSKRQKKGFKDGKLFKTTHQFVQVSFSNSKACDVCNKSMANKGALQCENCMVNVHENSCKDQIAPCARYRHPKLQRQDSTKDKLTKYQSSSLPGKQWGSTSSVKSSQSFKERNRAASVPARTYQVSQSSSILPRPGAQSGSNNAVGNTGYFQWRRVATKLGIDKVLNEERDKVTEVKDTKEVQKEVEKKDGGVETLQAVPTALDATNITETMSVSMESLDEGTADVNDFEDDPDLMLKGQDAEAWSVTVDKKTLKKMSAKDIKRQDHIWELIQTEKSHCRTLKIMQKIFSRGMLHELNMSQEMIDRIFPKLNDLLDIHLMFLHTLSERQKLRPDRSIENIGDVIVQQFEGEMGDRMKQAYGEFCSRHNEAVQLYKDILKSDRKFQNFIKKCSRNNLCKRLGIPECILLVTQRMTKYPLLIEPIIKTTKDNKADLEQLHLALGLARDILNYVDAQVDARNNELRLIEIFNKLDARSSAMYKGNKFKKSDLLSNNRKLIHEGTIKWMSARGRAFEVLAVILSDLIFFLSENNQKYTFFAQDNKTCVISLSKLLVREKGDTRDSKGIYLICQSKTEPEMYELVCRSTEDRRAWIHTIRNAIMKCPEEAVAEAVTPTVTFTDDGIPSESEEERKIQEAKSAKLRQLIDQLHQRDLIVRNCCEEKNKLVVDMLEIFGAEELATSLRTIYKDKEGLELMDPEDLLQAATGEATRLMSMLQGNNTVALSRSVSSVADQAEAGSYTPPLPKRAETFSGFEARDKEKALGKQCSTPPLPKRAETFSGFEAKVKDKGVKKRYATSPREELSHTEVNQGQGQMSPSHKERERDSDTDSLLSTDSHTSKVSLRRGSVGVPAMHEKPNNKDSRINRRMSTSFLQNLLIKQHNEKDDDSRTSSDRGSLGDVSTASSISVTVPPLIPPTKEHCAAIGQLMHYFSTLVIIASQQTTEVESFRAQLAEANAKVSRLYTESERLGHQKHGYQHDKQLEELRNLQESINQERANWEKVKDKENGSLEEHRNELQATQEELEKHKAEIHAQREELKRQREALQRQMDLFEQQKQQQQTKLEYRPSFIESSNQRASRKRSESADRKPGSRSESPAGVKPVPPSSVPQSLWDNVAHKRSSSEDLQRPPAGESFEPIRQEYSNSLKEPLNSQRDQTKTDNKISNSRPSPPGGHWEAPVPIHLLSATNEQKLSAHVTPQQLPTKLSSLSSSLSSKTTSSSSIKSSGSSFSQMLPFKLSSTKNSMAISGSSSPPLTSSNKPFLGSVPKRGSAMELSMTTKMVTPEPSSHHSSPATSPGAMSHVISLSRSQSQLVSNQTRLKPNQSHSILPMKLAEQKGRAKSASPSPQMSERQSPSSSVSSAFSSMVVSPGGITQSHSSQDTPKSSKHSQPKSSRKEPEKIIYF